MTEKLNVAVLGASGYTGSELVRLLLRHPRVSLTALTADSKAGKTMAEVFAQFSGIDLPLLVKIDELDLGTIDAIFCALPHATTQLVLKDLLAKKPSLKIVDLSADFRLEDPAAYEHWYGHGHQALDLQREAVLGLVELYRDKVAGARLVANPGCHTTTSILPIVPLLRAGAIDPEEIAIVSATGMSGAGRAAKEAMLFSEVSEGINAYGVGNHRHSAEFDQEYSKAAGRKVEASFTPLLVPMNRGILATIHVKGEARRLHEILSEAYGAERFVTVLPFGQTPQTRHIRGSNHVQIGVAADRRAGRALVISALDNLVKGASGQAIQNLNVMMGWPETTGVDQLALFP
jgi:N-acetyl-gamma-glutamyl-phosphate reductase